MSSGSRGYDGRWDVSSMLRATKPNRVRSAGVHTSIYACSAPRIEDGKVHVRSDASRIEADDDAKFRSHIPAIERLVKRTKRAIGSRKLHRNQGRNGVSRCPDRSPVRRQRGVCSDCPCRAASMAESSDEEETAGLFQEPEGFYQPEKEPTFVKHRMLDGSELSLRLVGHNALWVGSKSKFSSIRYSILYRHMTFERLLTRAAQGPPPLECRPYISRLPRDQQQHSDRG